MPELDKGFIQKTLFACKACGKECKLREGQLKAEKGKMFAVGNCSECGRPQRFDVTDAWLEEEE